MKEKKTHYEQPIYDKNEQVNHLLYNQNFEGNTYLLLMVNSD